MTYKSIVVHLDCGERRRERLALGAAMAREYGAELIGLFALDVIPIPPAAEATALIIETETQRREKARREAEQEFVEQIARLGDGRAQWRASEGDAVGSVCRHARTADLVIVGQFNPDTYEADGVPRDFVSDVVLGAGKPVLVVPFVGHFDQVGRRSFVAWNATREAARALTDAMPMLERAEAVEVAWFDPARDPDRAAERARADTAHYLECHGVKARVARHPAAGFDVGDLILSRAADAAADSIVMGAYGHSRVREMVLGGATRKLLKSMTVPVLMSH